MSSRIALLKSAMAATIALWPSISQALQKPSGTEIGVASPAHLEVDNLNTPLGIDDPVPQFSWQLRDGRHGAHQTAYQIQIASQEKLLKSGQPDVWDSGKIESEKSVGLAYMGPTLTPSTRYFWRVLAWDSNSKPYPPSALNWWETGLLDSRVFEDGVTAGSDQHAAKWIGYQTWYEAAVRQAGAQWVTTSDGTELAGIKQPEQRLAYRLPVSIEKPVRSAYLFVTGEDVASAWINGKKLAAGAPLPPWKQLPWKKYVRVDATSALKTGSNTLAVEVTHYIVNPNGMATSEAPPMSATLVVQYTDGSIVTFASKAGVGCKVSIHPTKGWTTAVTPDASF
jgi:alpha-L-rhamnosidase